MTDIAHVLDARPTPSSRAMWCFRCPNRPTRVALWIGHTWVYDQFDTTPYVGHPVA